MGKKSIVVLVNRTTVGYWKTEFTTMTITFIYTTHQEKKRKDEFFHDLLLPLPCHS